MTREKLKKNLPHGSSEKIADKANVQLATVSRWLNGKSENVKVELAVLEIVAEIIEQKKSLLARIG